MSMRVRYMLDVLEETAQLARRAFPSLCLSIDTDSRLVTPLGSS